MDAWSTFEKRLAMIRWHHSLIVVAALFALTPTSVQFAVAADGTTNLKVSRPAAGSAPSPAVDAVAVQAPAAEEAAVSTAEAPQADTPGNGESEVATEDELATLESAVDAPEESPTNEAVRELSVEPGTRPLMPENVPAWVNGKPDYSGDVHRLFVGSIATAKESNADRSLDEPLMAAVNAYIDDQVLHEYNASQQLQLKPSYIRRNLINDPDGYMVELSTSSGPMYQKWVTLEVSPEQRRQFEAWHREAIQRERIKPLAVGLAGLVGLIGLSHVWLRRKHGLPKSQPVSPSEVAKVAEAAAPVKKGGFFGTLIAIVCIFALPGLFVAMFAAPVFVGRQSIQAMPVTEAIVVDEQHATVDAQLISIGELEAATAEACLEAECDLQDSQVEVKLGPDGQQITIIRKSN